MTQCERKGPGGGQTAVCGLELLELSARVSTPRVGVSIRAQTSGLIQRS